ncbi:chromate transporter [Wilcoxina mikolae CBS 423.85]|nr:chromate transporter [Wilcoxina mikolae CBS 423.85]
MASEEPPKNTTTTTSSGSDVEQAALPQTQITEDDEGLEDNSNVPKLSIIKIFWLFFWHFGCFAWGGPVAQIALIKERLVLEEKWITLARFQRVFSVYQILPGPEAAELCMFFGCLSAGRLGGIVAGLGFMLPGFVLMVAASYLYARVGFSNVYIRASFRALQPIVAAMILRATHKLADHTILHHQRRTLNPYLLIAAVFTAINTALRINIFISLAFYGILYTLIHRRLRIAAGILFILQYIGYALYVYFRGVPSPVSLGLGIARTPTIANLFVLGLVAGTLSFGGAYTAIPFIQVEAVLLGGWLPQSTFIDCIAIGNILPAPLVIFATFVGFQGGLQGHGGWGHAFAGAIVITLGMFLPCFLFTIAGHRVLERLVRNSFLAAFFDGVCGAVIGIIAVIAAEILKAGIEGTTDWEKEEQKIQVKRAMETGSAAVIYMLALAVLYNFTHKYTAIFLVVFGAVGGQFIFVD